MEVKPNQRKLHITVRCTKEFENNINLVKNELIKGAILDIMVDSKNRLVILYKNLAIGVACSNGFEYDYFTKVYSIKNITLEINFVLEAREHCTEKNIFDILAIAVFQKKWYMSEIKYNAWNFERRWWNKVIQNATLNDENAKLKKEIEILKLKINKKNKPK